MKKWLTVLPDEVGFRSYGDILWESSCNACPAELLKPVYYPPLENPREVDRLVAQLKASGASLIHFHHEFGFVGSKIPFRYQFPYFVQQVRKRLPDVRLVATAHSVIQPDFKYPTQNRGWQTPLRHLANGLALPFLKKLWIQKSWGNLDGVTAHSRHQVEALKQSGCPVVEAIPHYVPLPEKEQDKELPFLEKLPPHQHLVVVFGYFTPEKAQDVVIRAMQKVSSSTFLLLAGGTRRSEDQGYFDHCTSLIHALGLEKRIHITGFIPFSQIDALFHRADLVVIPFRETSGSGSVADAICRHRPLLASDLPLNTELSERIEGEFSYFQSENSDDCALQINSILGDPQRLQKLTEASKEYAEAYSPKNVSDLFFKFYQRVESSS